MVSNTDLAWAAGFIDGEGSWTSRKTKFGTYQIYLQVQQKGREPLDRLARILPNGKIYQLKNRPEIFKFNISKRSWVIEAYELLKPYMCSVKIEQGKRVIDKVNGGVCGI